MPYGLPAGVLQQQAPLELVNTSLFFHINAANPASYPGSGTSWTDLTGAKVGTLYNGPTFSSENGGLITTDGINDYIRFAAHADFRLSLNWSGTLEVIFKHGVHADLPRLVVNERTSSAYTFFQYFIESTGEASFYTACRTTPPYAYKITSTDSVNEGSWNYVAASVTVPASTGNLFGDFCVNGNISSDTEAAFINMGLTNYPIELGRMHNYIYSTSYHACGNAIVRLYNYKLSPAEMINNYLYYRAIYGF